MRLMQQEVYVMSELPVKCHHRPHGEARWGWEPQGVLKEFAER